MDLAALHRVMVWIAEETAEQTVPLHGGAAPRPGDLFPARLPPQVMVSVAYLDALCALAGWSGLPDALEEVDVAAPAAPEVAAVTVVH